MLNTIFTKLLIFVVAFSAIIITPHVAKAAGGLYDNQPQDNVVVVQIDGIVASQIQHDGKYYIAGTFKEVKVDGGQLQTRNNFVVVDLATRAVDNWIINTNAPIQDIAIGNGVLYIGGLFTQINDKEQNYFVAFDIASQKPITLNLAANGPVNGLEVYENLLFIGGEFTKIDGVERSYLAAFDLVKKEFRKWNPNVNGVVNDLLINQNRLYVAGEFTQINGQDRTYLAAFAVPSGNLTSWKPVVGGEVLKINVQENSISVTTKTVGTVTLETESSNPITQAPIDNRTQQEKDVDEGLRIHTEEFGFKVPTLGDILTFAIRIFFVVAGLTTLFYLLRGALGWITSGGDKDSVSEARQRIQAAIIGLILVVAVLAIVWTIEQVIFDRKICFGLSCPLTLPALLEPLD
ncbi:hypothetical protein COV58_02125 [Candidatus Roizmanbacteria bacterium CG11_big_fil_rev_8_21_14_0_20_36_8]|uniref:Rax2-like C-terminal domain-containing protein n=1 Tax=Candidatus Roizmanbacteria bacterium CG11_big_fil_rev_8_21_14_0_20_36_8 TaxID=1974856 RepID=A0A2M6IUB5_9BACT|nr:MAG: hypothetical protein COV58_02125 [Candidatus Roizmanbacteria bacterium CG11_big_fil_rev_8_21_14_0_20_36_8]